MLFIAFTELAESPGMSMVNEPSSFTTEVSYEDILKDSSSSAVHAMKHVAIKIINSCFI